MIRLTCNCGAIYEATETKTPSGRSAFKCVLCGREFVSDTGANAGQFRLVWRPDHDRE